MHADGRSVARGTGMIDELRREGTVAMKRAKSPHKAPSRHEAELLKERSAEVRVHISSPILF